MSTKKNFRDALGRLAQLGQATGLQLVQIKSLDEDNVYTAEAIEFDDEGSSVRSAGGADMTVVNLAESPDEDGQLPADTKAVAVDVEGKWVILVRPTSAITFAAQVLYSFGDARYRVRPQVPVGENTFIDDPLGSDINACNLAELALEDTMGVDADIIVLVTALPTHSDPPTIRYAFDHSPSDEYN